MLRLIASLALLALAACTPPATRPPAEAAPLFALAPSALPGGLAEQQRLSFEHGDRRETVDAMVQADADAVRLVIHAQGQVALRLDWDGEQLTQKRMPWVPESLDGARVLSDLQLVFWPAEALRTQLPAGWTLDEEGARKVFRLIEALEEPYHLDAHHIVIGASIGIALASDCDGVADDLVKNADLALYRAKSDGRGSYQFYAPEMDDRLQRRRMLELDLRAADFDKEFELVFQPIVNLQSKQVAVVEALLRWPG